MPTLPLTLPTVVFTGSAGAVSSDVPGVYDVAIGGNGFMIDFESREEYRFQTVPLLRSQSDSATTSGANSINPEGLWRRACEEWHLGAGQNDYDRPTSDSRRYRTSKGINPWERWQLSLLPDVDESLSSSATNLRTMSAGTRLYVADDQTVRFTTDPFAGSPTYTAVTGTAAAAVTAIASTGSEVLIAQGSSGIYISDVGISTATSWITGAIEDVAYVKGRVLAANDQDVYEITAAYSAGAAAKPAALFTHGDSAFEWVGFAEGLNNIYAAGYSGDKSEIYRIGIEPDGTNLAAPTIAGRLPDGEIVASIYGYLGFILIGTTKGFRLAIADSNGNLTLGSLVETNTAVRCWEGQGQYVWFGWETFDSTSSGLGRLDLANLSDSEALVPAYASDLMATSQASITSVATIDGKRVFAVSGDGIYAEDTDLVASGTIDSGLIGFGLTEAKTAVNVRAAHDFSNGGTSTISLAGVAGSFNALGSAQSGATSVHGANENVDSAHELRITLERSSTDATKGPTFTSLILQAYPNVAGSQVAIIPLAMQARVYARNQTQIAQDVVELRDSLEALWRNRTLTTFQEGSRSHVGIIEDLAFVAEDLTDLPADFGKTQGVMTVRFKIIEGTN